MILPISLVLPPITQCIMKMYIHSGELHLLSLNPISPSPPPSTFLLQLEPPPCLALLWDLAWGIQAAPGRDFTCEGCECPSPWPRAPVAAQNLSGDTGRTGEALKCKLQEEPEEIQSKVNALCWPRWQLTANPPCELPAAAPAAKIRVGVPVQMLRWHNSAQHSNIPLGTASSCSVQLHPPHHSIIPLGRTESRWAQHHPTGHSTILPSWQQLCDPAWSRTCMTTPLSPSDVWR